MMDEVEPDGTRWHVIVGLNNTIYRQCRLIVTQAWTDQHTTSLAKAKKLKNASIDRKTRELIADGFVYATKTFSLSGRAQRYWTGMYAGRALLTYPLKVNTKDDGATYDILDEADAQNVYATMMGTVKGHLGSGTDLKDLVRAAADINAVDAVTDTR